MRLLCIFVSLLLSIPLIAAEPAKTVTIKPKEINDLLANPGMGWQTFRRFADEDPNLAGLPSGSAYFRFNWSELEPEQGHINFDLLDRLLARARRAGQKLAIRVACTHPSGKYIHVPMWLKDQGCPGFEFVRRGGDGSKHWVPDFESPIFQKAHLRFIAELGKRYDGHPDLDLVDIGSVGLFGEWHMSGTEVKMPMPETRFKIIDAYRNAFPRTPKVMLIGDTGGLQYATENGCGWRADCLGDMGGFSKTWNHMENAYHQNVDKADANDAWKTGPVSFESCWTMIKWKEEGWDIRSIFNYALDFHASFMNNKSAPIPVGTRLEVERFLKKLGYRLVLRNVEYPAKIAAGKDLTLKMNWENVGVAPPYREDLPAIRLTDENGASTVITGSTTIKGWLPGKKDLSESFKVPEKLKAGTYSMAIGIVEPSTQKPIVRLAIAGRDADGWYPLSQTQVE